MNHPPTEERQVDPKGNGGVRLPVLPTDRKDAKLLRTSVGREKMVEAAIPYPFGVWKEKGTHEMRLFSESQGRKMYSQ